MHGDETNYVLRYLTSLNTVHKSDTIFLECEMRTEEIFPCMHFTEHIYIIPANQFTDKSRFSRAPLENVFPEWRVRCFSRRLNVKADFVLVMPKKIEVQGKYVCNLHNSGYFLKGF